MHDACLPRKRKAEQEEKEEDVGGKVR